ncbi:MAG: DCC1-like thiol-disulfide oxidoreductase family protein [Candidatus Sericytochromatia bacterium]|nr:DCC1-like thiol-disulfide oxidoreductase family protein [Candidatus Sericytochromatia bacterium]
MAGSETGCEPIYVFYDGHCATCHAAVRWLLQRRGRERFRFVPLGALRGHSEAEFLQHSLRRDWGESLIVLAAGRAYERSEAVLVLLRALPLPWSILSFGRRLPVCWRDAAYDWVAANRYRWFGRAEPAHLCTRLEPAARMLLLDELPAEVRENLRA